MRAGLVFLVASCLARCTSGLVANEEEREERRAAPNRTLARAIDDVARAGVANDFRVRVEWSRGGRMLSAELYGNGAAIWNDERAFRVTSADIADVAHALSDARFAAMPDRFGEGESDFLTMRGKVSVAIGDAAKTVVQIDRGPQSDALAGLAAGILARAEVGGRVGVGAESLDDGLRKIAAGELPAEALRVSVQQRGDAGFLLQIRGGDAIARRFAAKSGFGAPRRMRVNVREFAKELQEIAHLQNGYAPEYTELRVEILGRVEERLARPESAGRRDAGFGRAVEALRAIAERTLAEGKPAPAAE
jgi:hypothetical protein